MELPIVDILSWVIVSENNANNKHKKGCPDGQPFVCIFRENYAKAFT